MSKEFKLSVLEHEYEYVSDDCLDAYRAMEKAREEGNDEEYLRWKEEWEQDSFKMELYEHEMEMVKSGADERSDYVLLTNVKEFCNEWFREQGLYAGFAPPSKYEDYGVDIYVTGFTSCREMRCHPYEVKSLRGDFGDFNYQTTIACRNGKCRYGLTGNTNVTQEEIEADTTPMPDWLDNHKRIAILNASTKKGSFINSKTDKLLKGKSGLIYAMEGEIDMFTPPMFRKAILGYVWTKGTHTTDFKDTELVWELKAVIDLDACKWKIKCGMTKEMLKPKK